MPAPTLRRFFGVQTPDPETHQKAIEAPGPSWREFVLFELAKVWILLALFILDSWIVVFWWETPFALAAVPSILAALYLEVLLYRFLWYQPDPEKEYLRKEFHRTWLRPTRFGRWTPEAWRIRDGQDPFGDIPVGPDPREFL